MYNVVLVSHVEHIDSVIHTHTHTHTHNVPIYICTCFCRFLFPTGYGEIFPCAVQ